MTIEDIQMFASQQRHMDIMEDLIFQLADQLKTMRLEHEEMMQQLVKAARDEPSRS